MSPFILESPSPLCKTSQFSQKKRERERDKNQMGLRFHTILHHAKHIVVRHHQHSSSSTAVVATKGDNYVPKGHLAVYVGENMRKNQRFIVPISYLSHPLFQDLLKRSEEEYGFYHPMGGITIPCTENAFKNKPTGLPKGHLAVYVGKFQRKRYVVPISYLNHPSFQDLLHQVEEEFGFNHPMEDLQYPAVRKHLLNSLPDCSCHDMQQE
ncbi:SAUR-like auxin-responsive protein family [Striga asiatica]|uniref:SAUR-like auxin-responsive protein family n=1 Tax=Striga asiatica TaxID=4170 RepID=A0A5A7QEE2_STRAF|nr:SAUR-like auxin-responsive protein family [Striga asiatica]